MTELSLLDLSLVATFAGAGTYLSSYLKKKGESKALREDFNGVLNELKKSTQAAEEIKSRISHLSWQEQKGWEIKKQFYFEAVSYLHEIKIGLINAYDFYDYPKSEHDEEDIRKSPNFIENYNCYLSNKEKLASLIGPSELILSQSAFNILDELITDIWTANWEAICQKDFLDKTIKLVFEAQKKFLTEAKSDLFNSSEKTL